MLAFEMLVISIIKRLVSVCGIILFLFMFPANAGFFDSLGSVVSKVAEVALPVAGMALSANSQMPHGGMGESFQTQQNYSMNNSDGFGRAESQNINMILQVQQQILQLAQQISTLQNQVNDGWPAASTTLFDYNKILPTIKESLPIIQKNLPFLGNFEPQIKRIASLIASINDYMLQMTYALNMMQSRFNIMNGMAPCFQPLLQPPNFSGGFMPQFYQPPFQGGAPAFPQNQQQPQVPMMAKQQFSLNNLIAPISSIIRSW